jgi:recombinational DNA repair protein (RecF pathway)
MTYITYTTDALVCGAFDRNTADRSYLLFTREAGMLFADAKSVREERSKQRFALQEFSQIRVSLIKGKHTWKVGSVEASHNDYTEAVSRAARGSVTAVYRTLRRFIQGEEASPRLYDFCAEVLTFVAEDISERPFVDLYVQICLMRELGYVRAESIPEVLREVPLAEVPALASERLMAELTILYEHATESSQL